MKNYLSYRWPDTPPEEAPPRPRKRRVAYNLLVALLLVALLAGVALGGWFLTRTALQRWIAQEAGGVSDAAGTEEPDGDAEAAEITMPRAEAGLGVTLELDETLDETLSGQEIYDLVLPAVVSVAVESSYGYGTGSGIILAEDGYILTNFHVIDGAQRVEVMLLENGEYYAAALVGVDEDLDIAVLKIEAEGLTAARFGDSDALRVGDAAYAIGNPMGYLYGTMTSGIISYVDRAQTVEGTEMTLIQTSAVLNSGNSGGPLVNERGQVVGITVAKVSSATGEGAAQVEGLGFAIPISVARPFINRILDAGETWRPVMGVICYAAEGGVMIQSLQSGGPAEAAGFQRGDLIVSANGKSLDTVYSLKRVLNDAGVGGTVACGVLRGGERIELSVTLVDSAELEAAQ